MVAGKLCVLSIIMAELGLLANRENEAIKIKAGNINTIADFKGSEEKIEFHCGVFSGGRDNTPLHACFPLLPREIIQALGISIINLHFILLVHLS